jgi:NAD(P)H-hydrate repair Nnr-like enzyme with NAD(P)H-hydrate dehydratase domain
LLIDADALNVLAENQSLLKKLPAGSIITPHMKEFDRLFGEHTSWWQRLQTAKAKAKELQHLYHPQKRLYHYGYAG